MSDAFAASKEAYHEDSDGNNSNVGHPKKPAWSKPLNGVVPVMGDAVSWPALSEATKPPSKSTPDVANPNESVSASQVVFSISVCLLIIMYAYYNYNFFFFLKQLCFLSLDFFIYVCLISLVEQDACC